MIEYTKKVILDELIIDKLDDIWFYIANQDWEYSEKRMFEIVEELKDVILDEKPTDIYKYIEDYIKKNYEFNI